ncbi:hypothetical protein FA95DRAFT_262129 [Auriscalpium vulgare]|uniref:Uncharacterized protein n=1 Tax=Auriscalpium vulgare TaxID=40419 RepID=A0ACB8RJY3_9AGAM|nr:hypothetical protein FA95DRAFT_262129 [Auriscalpium vulgare]
MAARPSRSSSIPIPRASSTTLPSFGDVLSMPMNASPPILPRPRIGSVTHSTIGMSPPARPTSRSYTAGGAVLPPVIPRIIRANHSSTGASSSASWEDAACTPPPSSPTRVRRPSAGAASLRSPSHRTFSHGLPGPSLPNYTPQVAPAPFPRPGYLEHSALRHLLQTELPPQLPPSRYAQPAPTTPAYTLRLEHAAVTPSSDSDEDSNGSPPPPPRPTPASATRPVSDATAMVGSSPVFRLPTRWSEQDRHTYLSVSADGRELNYNGFQSKPR